MGAGIRGTGLWMGLAGLIGCGAPDSPKAGPEPVDRVVDLKAEASTMRQMAEQLAASSGVPFRLAPGVDPERKMADPYQVYLPGQKLKEHLLWLEKDMGMWRFTWTGDAYEIRILDPALIYR